MSTTHIGSRLLLRDAHIANPGRTALLLSPVEVAADMFCSNMQVTGRTDLTGARIGGHLDLSGAHLLNPGGTAFAGRSLQSTELTLAPAVLIQGAVILTHARIGVLRDDPQRWPESLQLDGLTYEVLEPPLRARRRLDWLRRGPSPRLLRAAGRVLHQERTKCRSAETSTLRSRTPRAQVQALDQPHMELAARHHRRIRIPAIPCRLLAGHASHHRQHHLRRGSTGPSRWQRGTAL